MRALVSILVSVALFVSSIAVWWFYMPVWNVETNVRKQLPDGFASFSGVKFNRATGAGCGYVNAASIPGAPHGKTHFVLLPDGTVKFDPNDRITGTTLQQLEALRKHADYLALVYARCA